MFNRLTDDLNLKYNYNINKTHFNTYNNCCCFFFNFFNLLSWRMYLTLRIWKISSWDRKRQDVESFKWNLCGKMMLILLWHHCKKKKKMFKKWQILFRHSVLRLVSCHCLFNDFCVILLIINSVVLLLNV